MHRPATSRHGHGPADLRMALRHIPILPAPRTIEDLVARLDLTASGTSAALAQILQDARSENRAGLQEPKEGHRRLLGLAHSCWRTGTTVQLGARWPRFITASVLLGSVVGSTTPLGSNRPLSSTPTTHALDEIVSSSAPQNMALFDQEPRPLSIGLAQPAPSRGVGDLADDARVRLVRAPPASLKKIRTSRPHKRRARQRVVRAQYASFPAGLVCGVARLLLLRCNRRA